MDTSINLQPAATRRILHDLGWWILGLTVTAIIALLLVNSGDDPGVTFRTFSTRFLGVFIEAAPFLLMGTLVSGLIDVFVSREDIVRWIPRNPFLAALTGALMGFTFPVCECGVVPVVRRLFSKGLPMSVGVAFLLAAPVINPIVMASTYIAFWRIAPEIVIARFVITLIVAVGIGLIFAFSARPEDVLLPASLAPVSGGSDAVLALPSARRKPLLTGIYEALRVGGDEFFDVGKYLIIGSLLAAAMQTIQFTNAQGNTRSIQELLFNLGQGPLLSVIVMQLLAFVLSVCSTVDAFLALAFYGTFTGGSVIAFLTFGPMVDIKSTLMFASVFKPRVVVYLILLPLLMTMLIGLWINLKLGI